MLWGAADEPGQGQPLRPLLDCFDAAERAEVIDPGESVLALTERLLSLVDRACVAGPLVLVLDDLHWADEASLAAWSRLARIVERRALRAAGSAVIVLDPLPDPLVTELVDALLREGRIRIAETAELTGIPARSGPRRRWRPRSPTGSAS